MLYRYEGTTEKAVNMKLSEEWEKYRTAVVALGASLGQIRQLKMAFFGGASVVYYGLLNGISDGDDTTESDMKLMEDLHAEIQAFKNSLSAGAN